MHGMLTVAEIEDSMTMLPPFLCIVLELLATADDEESGRRVLATLFKRDPISASLLQGLAPSGLETDASQRLRRLREIVLINSLTDFAGLLGSEADFLEHSMEVGLHAQELGQRCGLHPEFALVAGLLHDIGRSWMVCCHPGTHLRVAELIKQSDRSACEIERELFGMDHCEADYCAARAWGVPTALLDAIAQHHWPPGRGVSCLVAVIHLADAYNHVWTEQTATAKVLGINRETDVGTLLSCADVHVHQIRAHLHGLISGIGHDVRFG